jgi:hypothetical protein
MPSNEDKIVKDFPGIVVADEFQSRNARKHLSLITRGGAVVDGVTMGASILLTNEDCVTAYRSGDHVYVSGFVGVLSTGTVAAGQELLLTLSFAETKNDSIRALRPDPTYVNTSATLVFTNSAFLKNTAETCVANALLIPGSGFATTTTGTLRAPATGLATMIFTLFARDVDTYDIYICNAGAATNPDASIARGLAFQFSYPAAPLSYVSHDDMTA